MVMVNLMPWFLAKGVQPIQELLGLVVAGAGNDLAQAVDEDMGDVINCQRTDR